LTGLGTLPIFFPLELKMLSLIPLFTSKGMFSHPTFLLPFRKYAPPRCIHRPPFVLGFSSSLIHLFYLVPLLHYPVPASLLHFYHFFLGLSLVSSAYRSHFRCSPLTYDSFDTGLSFTFEITRLFAFLPCFPSFFPPPTVITHMELLSGF